MAAGMVPPIRRPGRPHLANRVNRHAVAGQVSNDGREAVALGHTARLVNEADVIGIWLWRKLNVIADTELDDVARDEALDVATPFAQIFGTVGDRITLQREVDLGLRNRRIPNEDNERVFGCGSGDDSCPVATSAVRRSTRLS